MRASFVFLFLLLSNPVAAQTISGKVTDYYEGTTVTGVTVHNIYSGEKIVCQSDGSFRMEAKGDELLSFEKEGWRTERVRIPKSAAPSFYHIQMQRTLPVYKDLTTNTGDYEIDSTRYARLYERQLGFAKFSTLDKIQHPFSALSKTNRMIWAFQDNFHWFEQLKYVDYAFSNKNLALIAQLPADSADAYRRRYAMSYAQVRSLPKYELYLYIKRTVQYFREGNDPRNSPIRQSN